MKPRYAQNVPPRSEHWEHVPNARNTFAVTRASLQAILHDRSNKSYADDEVDRLANVDIDFGIDLTHPPDRRTIDTSEWPAETAADETTDGGCRTTG